MSDKSFVSVGVCASLAKILAENPESFIEIINDDDIDNKEKEIFDLMSKKLKLIISNESESTSAIKNFANKNSNIPSTSGQGKIKKSATASSTVPSANGSIKGISFETFKEMFVDSNTAHKPICAYKAGKGNEKDHFCGVIVKEDNPTIDVDDPYSRRCRSHLKSRAVNYYGSTEESEAGDTKPIKSSSKIITGKTVKPGVNTVPNPKINFEEKLPLISNKRSEPIKWISHKKFYGLAVNGRTCIGKYVVDDEIINVTENTKLPKDWKDNLCDLDKNEVTFLKNNGFARKFSNINDDDDDDDDLLEDNSSVDSDSDTDDETDKKTKTKPSSEIARKLKPKDEIVKKPVEPDSDEEKVVKKPVKVVEPDSDEEKVVKKPNGKPKTKPTKVVEPDSDDEKVVKKSSDKSKTKPVKTDDNEEIVKKSKTNTVKVVISDTEDEVDNSKVKPVEEVDSKKTKSSKTDDEVDKVQKTKITEQKKSDLDTDDDDVTVHIKKSDVKTKPTSENSNDTDEEAD